MQLSVKDSGTLGVLTLRGELNKHRAEELRAHLSSAFDRVNRLIVNCEQVTAVDLDCLRLLCTTYRVAKVLKKDFALTGDRIGLYQSAVQSAGYAHCMGAHFECGLGCLWDDNGSARYRPNAGAGESSAA